ncbi:hypothetical protein [Methylosinus sp. KRF6]|uniref:hypothetical protein n=1 Tax=Methylosinus sp. KRF6 TaxID=2846853 RepID=UPI001C0DCEA0|nr:hypothetical protein [Methylosinus sp. KRF6]MBU3887954.1 hypothetical protein [Methylosinus sp. KRF6]
MARTHVDVTAETSGGATSTAHQAEFVFDGEDSNKMTVEYAMSLIERNWSCEIDHAKTEIECGVGVRVAFKDGSIRRVAAWAD